MATDKSEAQDYFEAISDDELAGWQKYLQYQAALFASKELEFLHRLGFARDAEVVLDLGCGTGVFTRELSDALPDRRILAADANPQLLEVFRGDLASSPRPAIEVCEWLVGIRDCPQVLKDNPPQDILMRLVLQHTRDQAAFLETLKATFQPGTRIFIIEEDDGLYLSEPRCEALERVLAIYQTWADKVGSSRVTGRHLPRLAHAVGLKLNSLDILCHTGTNLGVKEFIEYYKVSIGDMPPDVYSQEESDSITSALAEYAERYAEKAFLYYPQVYAVLTI